jgi:hypothetical protein
MPDDDRLRWWCWRRTAGDGTLEKLMVVMLEEDKTSYMEGCDGGIILLERNSRKT